MAETIRVEHVVDFLTWRHKALQAIHAGISPQRLVWEAVSMDSAALPLHGVSSGDNGEGTLSDELPEAQLSVSKTFGNTLREASCCRIPDRWSVLYSGLWKWSQGQREVASPADDVGARLHQMAKSVRRDRHDFIAYLRFREQRVAAPEPQFVGWYEPDHDTLEWAAEHFADRMGNTSFMIATPDQAAWWNGATLTLVKTAGGALACPPVLDHDVEDSASTELWLTYYRSIFNPARLNERALVQHMPVRRWRGLPEAAVIPELIGAARGGGQRVGQAPAVGRREGRAIRVENVVAPAPEVGPLTLEACRRCPLWEFATVAVAGEGPADAQLMIVGEQPGDQEDLAGRVFVGPAGKLLNEAMHSAGIVRSEIYLTNAVKHFKWEPRGKRRLHKTPQQREIQACHYWLEEELARQNPTVIVTLGATALSSVMSRSVALTKHLNMPIAHEGRWVVPTYHPAFALRQPDGDPRERAFEALVDGLKTARELLRKLSAEK